MLSVFKDIFRFPCDFKESRLYRNLEVGSADAFSLFFREKATATERPAAVVCYCSAAALAPPTTSREDHEIGEGTIAPR